MNEISKYITTSNISTNGSFKIGMLDDMTYLDITRRVGPPTNFFGDIVDDALVKFLKSVKRIETSSNPFGFTLPFSFNSDAMSLGRTLKRIFSVFFFSSFINLVSFCIKKSILFLCLEI